MNSSDNEGHDPLPGVSPALYRAAQRARTTAARTGTPLVTIENGQIKKRWIDLGSVPGDREAFERYLKAVPDVPPVESDRLS